MFPGIGGRGMNPKKMKGMLKSMGINIDEVEGVEEVIIRTSDRDIVIRDAQVAIMDAQGSRSFQISGEVTEQPRLTIPDSDIELVMAQTGTDHDTARAALIQSKGDLAEAIVRISRPED
ncbi:MAG: Nascent polypeptide-associated complex protein [Methanosaeta sp. PtaB.Bin039]|nr:MAG: Nascent polypeptide-associated complex protein [Methanosaeta sp. PtaB.Bin039]OPY46664.1 MAG: Nascent polypeptide-associated complex protein [Methanosaeta sp. PtaU1.Bin028]